MLSPSDHERAGLPTGASANVLMAALDLAQIIIRDLDGRILAWSAGVERLYGWRRSEAVGRVSHELLLTVFPRPLSEIDAEFLRDGRWVGELRHRTRDGRTLHVTSHWLLDRDCAGVPTAVIEVIKDVTGQSAQRWLAAIVESSHSAVISKTLGGIVVNWNGAAEAMFGYRADEIVGRPLKLIIPPDRLAEEDDILARIRNGDKVDNYETRRRRKDGVDIPVSVIASPIRDPEGAVIGASTIMRDITERQQRDRQLQEMQSELVHMSRLTELGQMVSAFAHEVRQPLAAIANYGAAAQRLIRMGNGELARTTLEKLGHEVDRASGIIEHLRGLVKKEEAERRPEDIKSVVQDACALALVGAEARGIKAQLRCDPDLPPVVIDKVQVEQVLFNLMRNAIEAMAESPRRDLGISAATAPDGAIEISISDTGPGLTESIKANLFRPFVTTKANGMGLGLSICRSIVEAHGGRLWVEDNPGGGALFRFTLLTASGDGEAR